MKIFEIREMSTDEIKKRILEDQKNLVDLKFQQELKQLTNTAKLRLVRKDIAKMKTILQEREMQETIRQKRTKAKK
ncbi:MAG: 50S ribosomal protein L29 [Ignavibacteriales bacterium]|nr:50S ribosomal protein L29 [Ignavibacteriales bacterium]